tara:strand:+ start:1418 stop:2080 length:663 start_codon:yes stop_codon:yes gene_type:complete
VKNVRLYSYWRSSASWRARIALGLKGIQPTIVPIHLVKDGGEQHSADYVALNPMAQVPLLVWDDEAGATHTLTQSLAMMAFLDRAVPEPALVPADPLLAGRAWELAEIVNSGIQPMQNTTTLQLVDSLGGDRKAHAAGAIAKGLAAMETRAATLGTDTFFFGTGPSIAEVCLVPQLYNARRFGLDPEAYPRLLAAEAACAELAAFASAHPDAQPDRPDQP